MRTGSCSISIQSPAISAISITMNTGFVNYRLIRVAGRLFLNYQAAPAIYIIIAVAAMLIGRGVYSRLQVGK